LVKAAATEGAHVVWTVGISQSRTLRVPQNPDWQSICGVYDFLRRVCAGPSNYPFIPAFPVPRDLMSLRKHIFELF